MIDITTQLIAFGALVMTANIIRYISFLVSTRDVISSGSKRDLVWKHTVFLLLIFFLIGYIYVGFLSDADIMTASILFWGSIFVALVITLMSNLLETAKERSIDIDEVLVGVIDGMFSAFFVI